MINLANNLDTECKAENPFNNRPMEMYFCPNNPSFSYYVADDICDGATGHFEKYEDGDITGKYHIECMGTGVIKFKKDACDFDYYYHIMDTIIHVIKTECMGLVEAVNYIYRSDLSEFLEFEDWWL